MNNLPAREGLLNWQDVYALCAHQVWKEGYSTVVSAKAWWAHKAFTSVPKINFFSRFALPTQLMGWTVNSYKFCGDSFCPGGVTVK